MAAPDFWELRGEQGDTNGNLLCQILSKGSCSSVFSQCQEMCTAL